MKRIKKYVLFIFFIMLVIPFTAEAKAKATCSDVQDAVNELNSINEQVKTLKCDDIQTDKVLEQCNLLNINRASVLEDIFEYNDERVCPSIKTQTIVSTYYDDCDNELSSKAKEIADTGMRFFYIIAPFLLVLFGSLDFFKAMASSDPSQVKKSQNNFYKRIIAFVLLYLTPLFVKSIFSILPYNVTESNYTCSQDISFTLNRTSNTVTGFYNEDNYGVSGDVGKRISDEAKKIKQYLMDKKYTYGYPGQSVDTVVEKNNSKKFCCATLIGATLYRAKVYDKDTANSIKSDSAAGVTRNLLNKKWIVITDSSKLKAGDVLVYDTGCRGPDCGRATINGKTEYVGHVDIYIGDGKKVSTGDASRNPPGFGARTIELTYPFRTKTKALTWICALRYPGK